MSTKKPSLQDYLLIEKGGTVGKIKLIDLDSILLPITEGGPVEELETEIDELSLFLIQLSSDFAAEHQNISEIDKLYERKSVTDYMMDDPSMLKREHIESIISESDLATKEEVDAVYDTDSENADNLFSDADDKIDGWFD